ncbi:hypothetical protein P8C59_007392 [Phyllachora maydis]|uniref:tRNA (guanine-N(7)-)-methyltransferase non-catalytic subunit TRM82 n=1 Tax=Phyllachora maydis TaxID=1825666 RepID=A0AAD9MGU2_9PEZI|nr:hypothetical protein P8C59_007392 [Phyllachora maydis]
MRIERNLQMEPFVQNLRATPEGRHVVAVTGTDKTLWVFEHDGQGNLKLLSQRAMPKRPCALDFTPDRVTILVADKFGDRNLRALLDQRKAVLQPSEKPAAASFEHTLLLGHVSMLTGITHATDPHTGRPYIITADRDEHLRVSRGVLSQAHVIEGFCFGHDEFISRICIPPASPELLLSAGGDDEIYLWECGSGGSEPSHHVFVFCERVPAVFIFELTPQRQLHHAQTVPLPMFPLEALGVAGGPEESGDDQTKPEELQKLLYIAESLRKREGPGGEE